MILALASLSFSAAVALAGVGLAMVRPWESRIRPALPTSSTVALVSWFLAPLLGWVWSLAVGGGVDRTLWCVSLSWVLGVVYFLVSVPAGEQIARRLSPLYGGLAVGVVVAGGGGMWSCWVASALVLGALLNGVAAVVAQGRARTALARENWGILRSHEPTPVSQVRKRPQAA